MANDHFSEVGGLSMRDRQTNGALSEALADEYKARRLPQVIHNTLDQCAR